MKIESSKTEMIRKRWYFGKNFQAYSFFKLPTVLKIHLNTFHIFTFLFKRRMYIPNQRDLDRTIKRQLARPARSHLSANLLYSFNALLFRAGKNIYKWPFSILHRWLCSVYAHLKDIILIGEISNAHSSHHLQNSRIIIMKNGKGQKQQKCYTAMLALYCICA